MWENILWWLFLGINAVTDLKNRRIYVWINVIFLLFFGILCYSKQEEGQDLFLLLAGILTGVYLLLFSFLPGESVGKGDGIVVTVGGFFVKEKNIWILMGGLFFLLLWGGIKILQRKATGKSEIPFVPFYALSALLCSLGEVL